MKVIETIVYDFDELSDDAKQKAISELSDINVDYDWWDWIYEEAKELGFKISAFDVDNYYNIGFLQNVQSVAQNIIEQHGRECETYKTASLFLSQMSDLMCKYTEEQRNEEYDYDNDVEDLISEFNSSLEEDYRVILKNEYEYLTSEEAIIETIIVNGYTFTNDGKMKNY